MDDKFRLDRGGLALLWSKIAKILRGKQPKHNINGSAVSNSTDVYAPTSAGTSGQVLVSNGSGAPAWVNQKIDGVSFNGTADIVHYAVCNTPNNTQTKEVTLAGFNLVAGARISVKFTNGSIYEPIAGNPAQLSVTIGMNTSVTPNVPVKVTGNIVFPSSNYQINAGQVIDFYYDGTNFVTTTAMYAKKATLAENCETSNKANRIAVTAGSGIGAITDVDLYVDTVYPSDASSHPNRIYLIFGQ
jgi:hypothetical protein